MWKKPTQKKKKKKQDRNTYFKITENENEKYKTMILKKYRKKRKKKKENKKNKGETIQEKPRKQKFKNPSITNIKKTNKKIRNKQK